MAAFVEQMLCADADDIVLNMFSTFSRHIARIRTERHGKERRTRYFKRSKLLDGAAKSLGWQAAHEHGQRANANAKEDEELARELAREDEELAKEIAWEDEEIANAQGLDFMGELR